MPKYTPLTKEEKDEIINQHKHYVETLNVQLTNTNEDIYDEDEKVQLLVVDEDLEERLDNEDEIAIYRLSQELKKIKNKQETAFNDLAARHGPITNGADALLKCALKTEDTQYAREYNDKIYQDFRDNPNKVIAMLYRKVLKFNPNDLIKVGDDKIKLLEYYKNNREVIDLADSIEQFRRCPAIVDQNDFFIHAVDNELHEPLKVIAYPARLARLGAEKEYFSLPYLYQEQAAALKKFNRENHVSNEPLVEEHITDCADETNSGTYMPANYFKTLKEHKAPIDENFLTTVIAKSGNNTVRFGKILYPFGTEKIRFTPRSQKSTFELKCINSEYMEMYANQWGKDLNRRLGIQGEYNFENIKEAHKGNFFERWVFFSTSREYKNFRDSLGGYNDPASENYLRDDVVRENALSYLRHKGVNSEEDLANLKGTSLIRARLALETIKSLDNKKEIEKETDRELLKGYPPYREQILNQNDVEQQINVDNNIEPQVENVIENNNEIDNDIE